MKPQRLGPRFGPTLLRVLNRVLREFGYSAQPVGLGYLSAREVVPAAQRSGLSLAEYLEREDIGGVGRRRDTIISQLQALGALPPVDRLVEIGPGTGMFLERALALCQPRQVELYETAQDWRAYLQQTYRHPAYTLQAHAADGHSLHASASASADAIYAHGVMVYLPLLTTYAYLAECLRVLRPGGLLVFDVFLDTQFDWPQIQRWQQQSPQYHFPVVLSRATLQAFFSQAQLQVLGEFSVNYHAAASTYFVLRTAAPGAGPPRGGA